MKEAGTSGQISLVIFDCDGVLVDTEPTVAGALAARLQAFGVDITSVQCLAAFTGLSQHASEHLVTELLEGTVPDGWFDELTYSVDEALRENTAPIAGMREVLESLTVPFCAASNGRAAKLSITLEASGLAGLFADRVFTAEQVARGKPAPDLFLLAASRMGVPPELCVVVEDSPVGVAAARTARMRVFGYAASTDPADLHDADRVFKHMSQLPELLRSVEL
jgi:HAD superfamily hydrolase (TIGR01509 family)